MYILDVRRPSVALHVLEHDEPLEGKNVNGVSAAWAHHSHSTLLTGAADATVRLWDVRRAQPALKRLVGHTSPVSCVAWSPDDDLLASGDDGGKVVLYGRRSVARSGGAMHTAPLRVGTENDIVLMRQERADDLLGSQ